MAARTSLAGAVALAGLIAVGAEARAQAAVNESDGESDRDIIGADPGWRIEDVEVRTSYLDQRGHGFQAQGEGAGQPGSEQMYVIQPSALLRVRQSARVSHEVIVPVDAITAASPDAVDAMSSASRRNIAVDLDIRTAIRLTEHDTLTTRVAGHGEEPMGGGTLGAGYRRSLADDNATIGVNGSITVDGFDDHNHFGDYLGKTARGTFNANVSGSQLLSPTTVIDASYGITAQVGTLRTTWNAVPLDNGALTDEVMPRRRTRHALSLRLAQHVPPTRTTVKAWYRAYRDDFGLAAHTVSTSVYQYLVPWLYVRGGYRYHRQTGVDFFTTALADGFSTATLRTADSDLAPMSSHEWTVQLTTVRARGPLRAWSAGAELFRYTRSNDLQITAVSLAIGRVL